jgi:P22_AR N-terminal domain
MESAQQNQGIRQGKIVHQATAVFADAEITAVLASDGFIYASLPNLCRAIGLDLENQRERIDEHAVLTKGLLQFDIVVGVRVVTTWCLRANMIALWLTLVSVKRLREDRKERIYLFQEKAGDALDRLFGTGQGTMLPTEQDKQVLIGQQETSTYHEGLAIARMAEEQQLYLDQLGERITALDLAVEHQFAEMQERLNVIEAKLLPRGQISEEQSSHIADLVKQAAIAISQRSGGGNFFGTVYGLLYRRFGVNSYKHLSQAQYPQAVSWLEKMRDE